MRLTVPAALILLSALASAQTTHDVFADGFSYTPQDVVIDVGDTVRWTWGGGLHDVISGSGGIHDGAFASGSPVFMPGHTFEFTFDAAFLAANPVPGNVYDYFCTIHITYGMTGSVTVDTGPSVTPIGCTSPAGSLVQISGSATTGTTWTVGVTNPIPGAQTPGSFAFLGVSSVAAPGACGIAIPGWSMDPMQPAGELLIGVTPPNPIVQAGPKGWNGVAPAAFALPIPANPALVGKTVTMQGLIVDLSGPNAFGLSEGWQVVLD